MNNTLSSLQPVLSTLRTIFSPLWRIFEFVANIIDLICQTFGVLLLAGMWGLLLLAALAFWTDALPITWPVEITRYMVAWSLFIMMGPITRANEQIRVSFMPEKLLGEKKAVIFMDGIENVVGLLICIYLCDHAYELVIETKDLGQTDPSSAGWEYPLWIIRSGLLIGFSITALFYIERSIKWIQRLLTGSKDVGRSGSMLDSIIQEKQETEVSPETETGTKPKKATSNAPGNNDVADKGQE